MTMMETMKRIKTIAKKDYMYVCIYIYAHARTHTRTHACTHARTHACTHVRTHAHIHICIYNTKIINNGTVPKKARQSFCQFECRMIHLEEILDLILNILYMYYFRINSLRMTIEQSDI